MPDVIIADDSMFQRTLIARVVKQCGFEVREAKNGEECLNAINERLPNGLILDLNMPVMTGLEVLEKIKEMNVSIPAIVLTADIQTTTRQRCLDLGVGDFINKPLDEKLLIEKVQGFLK